MRTEHLEYLLEVARCKSISEAAQKLFIGQTSLSAIIHSIETELNIKIFQRSYQGIKITPQGEQAMAIIEEMVTRNSALHELFQTTSRSRKSLHLAAYPSACGAMSLALTEVMGRSHPDTSLVLHDLPYNKIIPSVVSGTVKIAVGSEAGSSVFSRQQEAQEAKLRYEELGRDRFCLAVRPDSPFAGRESAALEELYGEHLAAGQYYPLVNGSPIARAFRGFSAFTVFPNPELIKRAVARSGMVAIMPQLSFYDDVYVQDGLICTVPLADFPEELVNFLVYREQKLSGAEQALLDSVRVFYSSLAL